MFRVFRGTETEQQVTSESTECAKKDVNAFTKKKGAKGIWKTERRTARRNTGTVSNCSWYSILLMFIIMLIEQRGPDHRLCSWSAYDLC